ncbi:hypothetical protein DMJ13_08605 [halophilic archaeon]|nr:hypothetical protein DMJ13_08605 [halophilic archaeon]
MVSNVRTAPGVIERNDGRHDYLLHEGERYLLSLSEVGRNVIALSEAGLDADSLSAVPDERAREAVDERTEAYAAALDAINDHYFDARAFEEDARGKFHRYDSTVERNLRSTVAEEASACVEDLRRLLDAHDALVDALESAGFVDRDERLETVASRNTGRAVREGWYPVVRAYDLALNPGKRIAEGKKRRRQRLYGQSDLPGVAGLLDSALFERLTRDDLDRLRAFDTCAPEDALRVSSRLVERHRWLLAETGRRRQ